MSSRHAHIGLHATVIWPVMLGVLGILLYSAVYGGPSPSLAGDGPRAEGCIGERLAVEAWPAPADREAGLTVGSPADISPLAADL